MKKNLYNEQKEQPTKMYEGESIKVEGLASFRYINKFNGQEQECWVFSDAEGHRYYAPSSFNRYAACHDVEFVLHKVVTVRSRVVNHIVSLYIEVDE